MKRTGLKLLALLLVIGCVGFARDSLGGETVLNGHRFTLADGFGIELVAGPPLVERPICADLDHRGRLYVAESSGSNDNVQKQLQEKPHRILRLADRDGDGKYDERTIFADRMMFPEGTLWHRGSLYVAAPPQIWKLTDTDDDGVADRREIWFDAETLTGCANDLHGPYLGRDGFIYWCKGAFAEQTHALPLGGELVTRAAHIFRRHPDGGAVEVVMTGGMDNPVEVAFTPHGERIFTTTFLQHPAGGRRDGLIHAVYGGVYGKRHGVLDGHKQTGELLGALVHLGAAAPCGLLCRESDTWGPSYRHNLFACSFNMHKVTRHQLSPKGATFQSTDSDFLLSDQLDFHPTDVLEDGDGSLLVIDTGGWYKLCCPTSQLWKPDVLGAIYRVRKQQRPSVADPWGTEIPWESLPVAELAQRLGDPRPMVRRQATERLRSADGDAAGALNQLLADPDPQVRMRVIWAAAGIRGDAARDVARQALSDSQPGVRLAALAAVSLWRDADARTAVEACLATGDAQQRRIAAEALGRIGDARSVPALLACPDLEIDRFLEHSLVFALIEIHAARETQQGLTAADARTHRLSMLALDQMEQGNLQPSQVLPLLDADDRRLREAALWIVGHRRDWGPEMAPYLSKQLRNEELPNDAAATLGESMLYYATEPSVQQVMAKSLEHSAVGSDKEALVLDAMRRSELPVTPASWYNAILKRVDAGGQSPLGRLALSRSVSTALSFHGKNAPDKWGTTFQRLEQQSDLPGEVRLQAAVISAKAGVFASDQGLALASDAIVADRPLGARSLAADYLAAVRLNPAQQQRVGKLLPNVGPLEIERVLSAFQQATDARLGGFVLSNLKTAPAAASLPAERLKSAFAHFPEEVQTQLQEWLKQQTQSNAEKLANLRQRLQELPPGDVRRGQKIFHGTKASCYACHAMGYLGGNIGPDLTRIGRIRSDLDLLESILYPSASFVRSYEPFQVITTSGLVHVGTLREDNALEVVLTNSDRKNVRIRRDQIEEMFPAKVSIMPAGLDKQLSTQQLADLLEFLRSTR